MKLAFLAPADSIMDLTSEICGFGDEGTGAAPLLEDFGVLGVGNSLSNNGFLTIFVAPGENMNDPLSDFSFGLFWSEDFRLSSGDVPSVGEDI